MTYIVVPARGGGGSISLPDLVPITDGTFPLAGQVGEIQSASTAVLTTTGVGVSGAWGSAISLNLSAGVWELQGLAYLAENGAVLINNLEVGISASATGVGITDPDYNEDSPFLVGVRIKMLTPVKRVSIAAPVTYHLNTRFEYTSGTPQHAGILWAIRYS